MVNYQASTTGALSTHDQESIQMSSDANVYNEQNPLNGESSLTPHDDSVQISDDIQPVVFLNHDDEFPFEQNSRQSLRFSAQTIYNVRPITDTSKLQDNFQDSGILEQKQYSPELNQPKSNTVYSRAEPCKNASMKSSKSRGDFTNNRTTEYSDDEILVSPSQYCRPSSKALPSILQGAEVRASELNKQAALTLPEKQTMPRPPSVEGSKQTQYGHKYSTSSSSEFRIGPLASQVSSDLKAAGFFGQPNIANMNTATPISSDKILDSIRNPTAEQSRRASSYYNQRQQYFSEDATTEGHMTAVKKIISRPVVLYVMAIAITVALLSLIAIIVIIIVRAERN